VAAAELAGEVAAALVGAPVIADAPEVQVARIALVMDAAALVGVAAAVGGAALVGPVVAEGAAALVWAAAAGHGAAVTENAAALAGASAAEDAAAVEAAWVAVVLYATEVEDVVAAAAAAALVQAPLAWGLHYSSLHEPQQTSFVAQQQLLPLSSQSQ